MICQQQQINIWHSIRKSNRVSFKDSSTWAALSYIGLNTHIKKENSKRDLSLVEKKRWDNLLFALTLAKRIVQNGLKWVAGSDGC